MICLDTLTIKNFMSVGNVTQTITLSAPDLVLVLGENLDMGGNDSRNGVGKSAVLNALSYALYGTALTNIKKDNLINKTNLKNMLVTLTFSVNGTHYSVERGRKPNVFKFTEHNTSDPTDVKVVDESQGEGRHTQDTIVKLMGMSHDMFKHIVALNTYVEPFLALRAGDQRTLIEQLLGITKLSEKAELLKEDMRVVKDTIKEEEFKIAAVVDCNKRLQQTITSLRVKADAWEVTKTNKIRDVRASIISMMDVDIDIEIAAHAIKKENKELTVEHKALVRELKFVTTEVTATTAALNQLESMIGSTVEKRCPTCHQTMDTHTHARVHDQYQTQKQELVSTLSRQQQQMAEAQHLVETVGAMIPVDPITFYTTVEEAYRHKTTLDTLGNNLADTMGSENPFLDHMQSLIQDGLQEPDFTKMNELTRHHNHQEFLLKLLTNKDSFIRKKIIDQNLTYLNHRLSHYLTDIGLPHSVTFLSDLEVEISLYGKDFDFDNLSRGERTRLILSLSWAFRDVFESMNTKVNLMFVDELIDSGLDTSGVECALGILKRMAMEGGKSVFLISHREELIGRVTNVMKVVKDKGFTTVSMT